VTAEELVKRATEAAGRAYAPYSNYLVGAVVVARDGRILDTVTFVVRGAGVPVDDAGRAP
jgi:cytidine deaminase